MKIFLFSTEVGSVNSDSILELFKSYKDLLIRTSGSKGLDSLVANKDYNYEAYIPWNGFNGLDSSEDNIHCPTVKKEVIDILTEHVLGELKSNYVKIDNRLVCGILGKDLNDKADLVIINNIDSSILPTTSSALVERISNSYNIPVINLEYKGSEDLKRELDKLT